VVAVFCKLSLSLQLKNEIHLYIFVRCSQESLINMHVLFHRALARSKAVRLCSRWVKTEPRIDIRRRNALKSQQKRSC